MRRLIARLCVLLVCARTQDVGDDGDLLDALLESMTFAISERFQESHDFLRTRAWYGNSHIGNRPKQARAYFDVARRLRPRTICEIGFNGGHSAAIFLAAAGSRASMISFDLQQFTYSSMATRLVQAIFPGQLHVVEGLSQDTVPRFAAKRGRVCDLFSVDGDHSYEGTARDIANAAAATRGNGMLILDDVIPASPPRRAFDEAVAAGTLVAPACTENVAIDVSYVHRRDQTKVRHLNMSWCTARVPDR